VDGICFISIVASFSKPEELESRFSLSEFLFPIEALISAPIVMVALLVGADEE
jgi:hypothetical protein